jgi:bifunctional DNase/RNase
MKKKKISKKFLIIFIILIISISINLYFLKDYLPLLQMKTVYIPSLSLEDYTKVEFNINQQNQLTFTANCKAITMTITQDQTLAILEGIQHGIAPRPLTQDVFKAALDSFKIQPILIKISSIENDIYKAELFLKKDNKIISIDSRPSDITAISVRYNLPIYIKNSILEEKGINIC